MSKTLSGERTTALVSATLAIAILAAMGTAQPTRTAPTDPLAALESDLRYQINLSWRANVPERTARLGELEAALAAWRKASQTPADRQLMVNWLQESIRRSLPREAGPLPTPPVFSTPALARRNDAPAGPAAALRKGAPPQSKPTGSSPAEPRANAQSAAAGITAKLPVRPPSEARAPQVAASSVERPIHISPPVPIDPPAGLGSSGRGAPPVGQAVYVEPPQRTASSDVAPQSAMRKPTRAPEEPTAVAQRQPMQRSTGPRRSSAERSSGAFQATAAPAAAAIEPPVASSSTAVDVNLVELNARIGGYHDGLDEATAELVVDKSLNTLRMTRLVGELEELAAQHEFIMLYFQALSDRERKFVLEPRPIRPTLELAERQRRELEEAGDDFLTSAGGARRPSKLAQRLEELLKAMER